MYERASTVVAARRSLERHQSEAGEAAFGDFDGDAQCAALESTRRMNLQHTVQCSEVYVVRKIYNSHQFNAEVIPRLYFHFASLVVQ